MTNPIDIDDPRYQPDDSDIDYDAPARMPNNEAEALERASWHLRLAAAKTAEKRQIEAVYRAEIERLQMRRDHRLRILDNEIAWHEEPVRSLHEAIRRDNPKRKTIELPYGTSRLTVPATPKVEITDTAAVLSWAEKNRPEIVGHTINVTGVRSVAKIADPANVDPDTPGVAVDTETGEIIPGTTVTLGQPTWKASYE